MFEHDYDDTDNFSGLSPRSSAQLAPLRECRSDLI